MKYLKPALLYAVLGGSILGLPAMAQECATKPVVVGMLPKLDTDPYFQVAKGGAEDAAKEIGGSVVQAAPSQATPTQAAPSDTTPASTILSNANVKSWNGFRPVSPVFAGSRSSSTLSGTENAVRNSPVSVIANLRDRTEPKDHTGSTDHTGE